MNDHVARMVHGWLERKRRDAHEEDAGASQLVDAIHRMIREAEDETRGRCEDIAKRIAGPELGGQIALAIRMDATGDSLPRRSLVDVREAREARTRAAT
jgi:hypothetical protein